MDSKICPKVEFNPTVPPYSTVIKIGRLLLDDKI